MSRRIFNEKDILRSKNRDNNDVYVKRYYNIATKCASSSKSILIIIVSITLITVISIEAYTADIRFASSRTVGNV